MPKKKKDNSCQWAHDNNNVQFLYQPQDVLLPDINIIMQIEHNIHVYIQLSCSTYSCISIINTKFIGWAMLQLAAIKWLAKENK